MASQTSVHAGPHPGHPPHPPALAVHRARVLLCLFVVYFIWGSAFLAIRIAVGAIPPLLMHGSRSLLAGLILYAFLRARGVPSPGRRQWLNSIAIGLLLISISGGCLAWAERSVDSGLSAIFLATTPIWTALFAGIWERWPSRFEIAGLVLGFAAVALLSRGHGLHGHPLALAALLCSSICWSFGSILGRHLELPRGTMAGAAQLLIGGAALIVVAFASGERIPRSLGATPLAAFLYLGLISSLLGFSAFTYLIHNTRPSLALSYEYVNPAVAVLLGALYAGERVRTTEGIALALTVVAVLALMQGRGPEGMRP